MVVSKYFFISSRFIRNNKQMLFGIVAMGGIGQFCDGVHTFVYTLTDVMPFLTQKSGKTGLALN
jgi:hypothetical protein